MKERNLNIIHFAFERRHRHGKQPQNNHFFAPVCRTGVFPFTYKYLVPVNQIKKHSILCIACFSSNLQLFAGESAAFSMWTTVSLKPNRTVRIQGKHQIIFRNDSRVRIGTRCLAATRSRREPARKQAEIK